MNRQTTDKIIVYVRNTESANNKTRKVLFVSLRLYTNRCDLLRKIFRAESPGVW